MKHCNTFFPKRGYLLPGKAPEPASDLYRVCESFTGIKQSLPQKLVNKQNFFFRASKQVDNEGVVIQNECSDYCKLVSCLKSGLFLVADFEKT